MSIGATVTSANYEDFVVLRLKSDGSLDPSFGTGGVASADIDNNANPKENDGRIYEVLRP